MTENIRLRDELRALESRRPSRQQDPEEYRRATEDMARRTDEVRAWNNAKGRKVV